MKDDHQMSEREMRYWLKQFGVEVAEDEVLVPQFKSLKELFKISRWRI